MSKLWGNGDRLKIKKEIILYNLRIVSYPTLTHLAIH